MPKSNPWKVISVRSWLALSRFWDSLLSYYHGGLDTIRGAHGVAAFPARKRRPKKKLSYQPSLEALEVRVVPAVTPDIIWTNPSEIVYGTALDSTQLDASASSDANSVSGTFTYSPEAGAVLSAGNNQTLTVTFTPDDTIDFTTATGIVTINVDPATLTVAGIAASNKTYDGNNAATLDTSCASLVGPVLTGDIVTLNTTGVSGAFSAPDAATGVAVQVSGLALAGAQAGDYALAPTTIAANITPAALTITATNVAMDYADGTTLDGDNGFTASGLQGSDAIDSVELTTDATTGDSGDWNVGSWTITPSAAAGANFNASDYSITYVSSTLTVRPPVAFVFPHITTFTNNVGDQTNLDGDAASLAMANGTPAGAALNFIGYGLPPGLSIDGNTGLLSGTIANDADTGSPYSVAVVAIDSNGSGIDMENFSWFVQPVIVLDNPGSQMSYDGDSVTLALSASDGKNDAVTFSASGLPTGLVIDANSGAISGAINTGFNSAVSYPVIVTATDATADISVSQTFNWNVSLPVLTLINPGDQSNFPGDAISFGVSAADEAGHSLGFSATGLPEGLSIDADTGIISGTIANGADTGSPYSVTVTATDSSAGFSANQGFEWDVQPLVSLDNPGDQANYGGDSVRLVLSANDAERDLSFDAIGLPSGLAIDSQAGIISGTVANEGNVAQLYPITVTVTDPDTSISASQMFNWAVTPAVVTLDNPGDQTNADGDTVNMGLTATSSAPHSMSYSITGLPPGLGFDYGSGVISGVVTDTADTLSPYSVTVTAIDDQTNATASQTFTWVVQPLGTLVNPGDQTSFDGDVVNLAMVASNSSSSTQTFNVSGLPSGLSFDAGTGLVSGTIADNADTAGTSFVAVTMSDANGNVIATEMFDWFVQPLITFTNPGDQEAFTGDTVSVGAEATDARGNALTYGAAGLPSGLSIDADSGVISGAISAGANDDNTATITTMDNASQVTATETFDWFVYPLVALENPGDQTNLVDDAVSLTLAAVDGEGNALLYSASGLPDGVTIDSSTGVISGTIADDAALTRPNVVTVTASDGSASVSQTFNWNVQATASLTAPANQTNFDGDTVTLNISVSDPAADPVTFTALDLPGGLSIDSSTGTITGTIGGNADFSSPYTVAITITDQTSDTSVSQEFTWTVNPAVTWPNAGDQTNTAGDTVNLVLAASDADANALTYSATGLPPGLAVDSQTGAITGVIASNANTNSPYAVTVIATDGLIDEAATQTFDWTVNHGAATPNVTVGNESFSISASPNPALQGDPVRIWAGSSGYLKDEDGDYVDVNPTGTTDFYADGQYLGESTVEFGYATYTVSSLSIGDHLLSATYSGDANFPGASASVYVTILPVVTLNSPGNQRNNEWDTAALQISGSDAHDLPLTYSATGLPSGLQIDGTSGSISGFLQDGSPGTYNVTVTASDGANSGSVHFTWSVYAPITATVTATPDVVDVGQPVLFTVVASNGSGTGYTYAWDFDDGTTGTGASVVHIYQPADSIGDDYAPSVTVTDDFGNSTVETVEVAVVGTITISDAIIDDSSDASVQQTFQTDQTGADAAILASDQSEQQAIAAFQQPWTISTGSGDPSLSDTLSASDLIDDASMRSADSQYSIAMTAEAGQLASSLQAALDTYNAAANLMNQTYNSTIDQANSGYTATVATISQSYLSTTDAADATFQQQVQDNGQTFTAQVQSLQQSLDTQVATDEQAYTAQVNDGQASLQSILDAADQAFSDEVQQLGQQDDQTNAVLEAAATQITSLADAAAQAIYDQDQATFDQANADAEAQYAGGPDDQAVTVVPDFVQDPTVAAAVISAQAAYAATTQQADTVLTQELQGIQTALQSAYVSANAAYNQSIVAAQAAEDATVAQADQVYSAATTANQQTHDSAVGQATDTYYQTVTAAQQLYDSTVAQAAQTRQAAEQADDDNYLASINGAWGTFSQIQQQANATCDAIEQAARNTYNTTVSQAQASYEVTAAQLQSTFNQQQSAAQTAYDSVVTQADNTRATTRSLAQQAYDAANQAAERTKSAAYQPAWQQYLADTTVADRAFDSSKRTIKRAMGRDTADANKKYEDSVRAAAQVFWDFMNNCYTPGIQRADRMPNLDDRAAAYATYSDLRMQAQQEFAIAKDRAALTLAEGLGDIQVEYQPQINAAEKAKFDAYLTARTAFNNAMNAARIAYDVAMAQPIATLAQAQAQAQETWLDTLADAGKTMDDAKADAEAQYDAGITSAKKTLADTLAGADKALSNTIDPAIQTRDRTIADAQAQLDISLANAELAWKDAREAAVSAQEQTVGTAYTTYTGSVTTAGVAYDDAVTAADVAMDEADANAGVAWTAMVAAAWETRQIAEANAISQWTDAVGADDQVALQAEESDYEAWNATCDVAWQTSEAAMLTTISVAVDHWAELTGTRFAQMLDREFSTWTAGQMNDDAGSVADQEAGFSATIHGIVQEAEANDATVTAAEHDLPTTVQAEADATVAETLVESQAAANTIAAEDTSWQNDEHAAAMDRSARDLGNAAATVADANATQAAQDAWEHTEAVSARDDQVTVAQANDQSADADADATRAGNDAIAIAVQVGASTAATAAQTRDTQVEAAHHAMVYAEAAAVDAAVNLGAAEARGQLVTNTTNAVAQVPQVAIIISQNLVDDNATRLNQEIRNHDAMLVAVITRVTAARTAKVADAQQKLTADLAAPATNFLTVNPQIPQNAIQILNDYTPDWQTVVIVGVVAIVGVTVSVLVPGAGPVLAAVLLARVINSGVDRYFEQNQSLSEVWLGAQADALGITQVYAGITNRDIATNEHLGLTVQQQRAILGEAALEATVTLVTMGATRFARGMRPAAPRPRVAGARGGAARPAAGVPRPPAPPGANNATPLVQNAQQAARGGVYVLRDPVTGQVVRTGRTRNLARRRRDHRSDPNLRRYDFEVVYRTDVHAERRGLEQILHLKYKPPLNYIGALDPQHSRAGEYLLAAVRFLKALGGGG